MALPLFEAVNAKRDRAVRQVSQHAGPSFLRDAQAFIVRYLREHGETSGEELTVHCKNAGIAPHDDRAFGAVYLALARAGTIRKVGQVKRRRGHNTSGGNVWGLVR